MQHPSYSQQQLVQQHHGGRAAGGGGAGGTEQSSTIFDYSEFPSLTGGSRSAGGMSSTGGLSHHAMMSDMTSFGGGGSTGFGSPGGQHHSFGSGSIFGSSMSGGFSGSALSSIMGGGAGMGSGSKTPYVGMFKHAGGPGGAGGGDAPKFQMTQEEFPALPGGLGGASTAVGSGASAQSSAARPIQLIPKTDITSREQSRQRRSGGTGGISESLNASSSLGSSSMEEQFGARMEQNMFDPFGQHQQHAAHHGAVSTGTTNSTRMSPATFGASGRPVYQHQSVSAGMPQQYPPQQFQTAGRSNNTNNESSSLLGGNISSELASHLSSTAASYAASTAPASVMPSLSSSTSASQYYMSTATVPATSPPSTITTNTSAIYAKQRQQQNDNANAFTPQYAYQQRRHVSGTSSSATSSVDSAAAQQQQSNYNNSFGMQARGAGVGTGGSAAAFGQSQQQPSVRPPSNTAAQPQLQFHAESSSNNFSSTDASQRGGNAMMTSAGGKQLSTTSPPNNAAQLQQQHQQQQQQQQQQNTPSEYRPQPWHCVLHDDGLLTNIPGSMLADPFGLSGFVLYLKTFSVDQNLLYTTLGTDLTSMGVPPATGTAFPRSKAFFYPFFGNACDSPSSAMNIDFPVPPEYLYAYKAVEARQKPLTLKHYSDEVWFMMFYAFPQDLLQTVAGMELYSREWRWHKSMKIWITKMPQQQPIEKTVTHERGTYIVFDVVQWKKTPKELIIEYRQLEDKPQVNREVALLLPSLHKRLLGLNEAPPVAAAVVAAAGASGGAGGAAGPASASAAVQQVGTGGGVGQASAASGGGATGAVLQQQQAQAAHQAALLQQQQHQQQQQQTAAGGGSSTKLAAGVA